MGRIMVLFHVFEQIDILLLFLNYRPSIDKVETFYGLFTATIDLACVRTLLHCFKATDSDLQPRTLSHCSLINSIRDEKDESAPQVSIMRKAQDHGTTGDESGVLHRSFLTAQRLTRCLVELTVFCIPSEVESRQPSFR